ncbi:MAG: hypothetical protein JXL82_02220 [Candidatus Omnitrophica bacterium]|nr:hypothetical protein [Candidatus Omnitrophota bacterium]
MKIKIMPAIFLISLLFTTCVFADTVTLKSGQKVEGKIIERADKYVKVDFQGVILTYYQDEIANIQADGREPVSLTGGKSLGFNPSYVPIDFSGLAEHYPVASKKQEETYTLENSANVETLNKPAVKDRFSSEAISLPA